MSAVEASTQSAGMPKPLDLRSMSALHATLPIPASALVQFPHINPRQSAATGSARGVQNTADNDGGGQAGYIINPGPASGDGGIYVAMTAYDDAWVTTPSTGSYNTVNAPTTHGPNGNCIETVTNYYNGFGTPGTTVDQVQFYDFCANGGAGGFVGAISMDASFVRDYVRTYADSVRPMPRYISAVEYVPADRRYHAYLYNASLMHYVDFYDSPPGATTDVLGSEGWSIYETHYNGGDCTALPDASEDAVQVHTPGGWKPLGGNQAYSYVWGTCFSGALSAPYNVAAFSPNSNVAWTVSAPVAAARSAYARVVLAAAPSAYYRLGDSGLSAGDSGGSNLTGRIGANVARNSRSLLTSESFNAAVQLPGGTSIDTNFISVAASTKLQPPGTVSVETWVQESRPAVSTSDLVAYGSRTSGLSYTLQVLANNTLAAFVTTSSGYGFVASTTAMSVARPYLVDLTYTGKELAIYVDGALEGSSATTGSLSYARPSATNGLTIGSANDSTRPVFAGVLDEVAVFSQALTAAQIASHWTAGTGVAVASKVPEYATVVGADAPLAFYRLDDTSRVAADASANASAASYGTAVVGGVSGLLSTAPTDTAAKFSGGQSSVNAAVTTARNTKLEPQRAVSVEAWVDVGNSSAGTLDLVSYGPEKLGQPYTLQLLADGKVALFITTRGGAGYGFVQSATSLRLNTPHLVDATYDGSTMRIFVDGVLDASAAVTGALSYAKESAAYGLSIGTAFDTDRPAFRGVLDEVAIYATALTAGRVAAHWSAGSGHAAGP